MLDVFYHLDLSNFEKIREVITEVDPEVVFHLAGVFNENLLEKLYQVNTIGTANLLKAIHSVKARHKIRILLISSAAVYGFVPKEKNPIREDQPICPMTHYGISKAALEMLGRLYANDSYIEIIISRTFNLIGTGLSDRLLPGRIAKEIAEIKKGHKGNIIKAGNIDSVRDFLDVRDAVRFYVDLILYGKSNEIYNVGSGKGIKIDDLLKIFISKAGMEISIYSAPELYKSDDIEYSVADITKLSRITSVYPQISIEESIAYSGESGH